jgi:hypothetical protein
MGATQGRQGRDAGTSIGRDPRLEPRLAEEMVPGLRADGQPERIPAGVLISLVLAIITADDR